MNAKEYTLGALKQLQHTIESEGHVHLIRIARKHMNETPRIEETLPSARTLFKRKKEEYKARLAQIGLTELLRQEKESLKSQLLSHFFTLNHSLTLMSSEVKEQPGIQTALKGLFRTAGLQWGTFLPPRNLKLQHHGIEQHFILFKRVPIFVAEVSTEWWNFMLETTLRKNLSEEERYFLLTLQALILEFRKGFTQGMDFHTYLQQFFSLKSEVLTSKDVTIPMDPFSFQLFERFFASLLNPPRESV